MLEFHATLPFTDCVPMYRSHYEDSTLIPGDPQYFRASPAIVGPDTVRLVVNDYSGGMTGRGSSSSVRWMEGIGLLQATSSWSSTSTGWGTTSCLLLEFNGRSFSGVKILEPKK